ncbi:MAG TPA: ACT domain-containing protein, partial [Dermatophilaceae bacterium]|nr:ACT domain-containing protein [Dermatophilaceae bacterium]
VRLLADLSTQEFRNTTTLRGAVQDGRIRSVSGTLTGPKMVEKLIGIDGYDLEIPLADHLAIFTYDDRPGIIGTFGRILGERGINIGAMQVARSESGDKALVVLTADSEIPHEIGAEIAEAIGSESFTVVNL